MTLEDYQITMIISIILMVSMLGFCIAQHLDNKKMIRRIKELETDIENMTNDSILKAYGVSAQTWMAIQNLRQKFREEEN